MRDPRVDAWLSRLELARYCEVFAAHAIEWDVLPDLHEADLEMLGIPLGHRKKLLSAIRRLGEAAFADPPPQRSEAPQRREAPGESPPSPPLAGRYSPFSPRWARHSGQGQRLRNSSQE